MLKTKLSENSVPVIFGKVSVYEQESLPENIDLDKVLRRVENCIPFHFVEDLDVVYVGVYDFLMERDLTAMYDDGAIYISAFQDDEDDLYDDLVHEIAHCVENTYAGEIYGDGLIEKEFLGKRKELLDKLRLGGYNVTPKGFMEPEYSEYFDDLLYVKIGYPSLVGVSEDIFVSPYGATSLREYFANCFEEIFAKRNYAVVKQLSPCVYGAINNLL